MKYYAKITRDSDGHYLVMFPDLDGCCTWGNTLQEAKHNAWEALNVWLSGHCKLDDSYGTIPRPRLRRSKGYHAVEVDPLAVQAVTLRQVRMAAKLSRPQMARRLGLTTDDYAKLELPLKIRLPRSLQPGIVFTSRASIPKKGGVTVHIALTKKTGTDAK